MMKAERRFLGFALASLLALGAMLGASFAPSTESPKGFIGMWSGTLANVPRGWSLCDGTNGTPDLRDKFIYGWSSGVDPGGTGGATTHTHGTSALANSSTSGGTPAGTVSQPTFTGDALSTHTHGVGSIANSSDSAGTPAGTISGIAAPDSGTANNRLAGAASNVTTTHTHPAPTFTGSALGAHTHTISGTSAATSGGTPSGTVSQPTFTGSALSGHTHTISGSTDSGSTLPPYYKLAFIMKL